MLNSHVFWYAFPYASSDILAVSALSFLHFFVGQYVRMLKFSPVFLSLYIRSSYCSDVVQRYRWPITAVKFRRYTNDFPYVSSVLHY